MIERIEALRKARGLTEPMPRLSDEELLQAHKEQIKQAEQERRRERHDRLVRLASVPPRFSECSVKGFEATVPDQGKAKRAVQWYCENLHANVDEGRCLMLIGNVGTGKTHLACAIVNHAVRLGIECRYVTVATICRGVRSTYAKQSEQGESEVIADWADVPLLVVDEVGVQNGGDFERRIMFEIIDHRYANSLPTIVAGNVEMDEAIQYLGERVVDRLRDGGLVIPFAWPSRRITASRVRAGNRPGESHD